MKRVIIMGASSGIGLALARALASRRVRIGIAARHTEPLRKLQQEYPAYVEFIDIDITKPEAIDRLHLLIERTGGMDYYVHVAGIGYENLELQPEREVEILNTNVCGFARMICAAYRWFRDHGVRGHIAAVTSVAGTNGIGRLSAYSSSKKFDQTYLVALEQLSNIEKAGVTFTDIRPGWVRTPLLVPGLKYPMEMSVDHVLPYIIRAIVRKERVCVVDNRWNLLVGAWRLLPNALWTLLPVKISTPDCPVPAPGSSGTAKEVDY